MPFTSPNYTQTPNDLFDKFLPDLGDAELRVLLAIIRQTFGFRRSKARISLTRLEKATGLSRQSALTGATALEARSLITKFWDGGVTEYEILIEDPDQMVNLLDQSGQVNRPDGQVTRPPTIKEKGLKKGLNINDQGQAPTTPDQPPENTGLEPDTPGAYRLFNLLGDELAAQKRRPPKRFPSLACKRKFLTAEERLGELELEKAITKALEKPILSISGIVAFLWKWSPDYKPPRGKAAPDQHPRPAGIDDEQARKDQARALIEQALLSADQPPAVSVDDYQTQSFYETQALQGENQ